jgi:hypothetical protein
MDHAEDVAVEDTPEGKRVGGNLFREGFLLNARPQGGNRAGRGAGEHAADRREMLEALASGRKTFAPKHDQGLIPQCSSRAAFQTSRAASAFIAAMPSPTIRSGHAESV